MQKRYIAAYISIALVATASIMVFFVRPHPSTVELDTEVQELPDLKAHYSNESGLSERVSKSHGLALVLVISEYSRKNAVALESLRSWAHDNFQKDPGFLHQPPQSLAPRPHNSIIDAFCYSLFTGPRLVLENQVLGFLRNEIALFHTTKAYQSFRADYFDSFGTRSRVCPYARALSIRTRSVVCGRDSLPDLLVCGGVNRNHSAPYSIRSRSLHEMAAFARILLVQPRAFLPHCFLG